MNGRFLYGKLLVELSTLKIWKEIDHQAHLGKKLWQMIHKEL